MTLEMSLIQKSLAPQAFEAPMPAQGAGAPTGGVRFDIPAQSPIGEVANSSPAGAGISAVMDRIGVGDLYQGYVGELQKASEFDAMGPQWSGDAADCRARAQGMLLEMQVVAQEHHAKIELASKLVDTVGGGARTVLQTQV